MMYFLEKNFYDELNLLYYEKNTGFNYINNDFI